MNVINLHTLNEYPATEVYHELNEAQLSHFYEPAPGLFIAESPNVIIRALDGGYRPESFLVKTEELDTLQEMLTGYPDLEGVPVYAGDEKLLSVITGFHLTKGIFSAMRRKSLPEVSDLIADKHRIAVLEDVTNPTNVGAIMRCAAALNMEAVILSGSCADPLYRRACRVSVGTCFQIPWTFFKQGTVKERINILHDAGFRTAALALTDDSVSILDKKLKQSDRLALILGNEGYGLPGEVLTLSDYTVKIPMSEGIDSLNVAAAAAVAFWEAGRKEI